MASTASTPDLTRLVPGFDFLQGLMKGGSAGMPGFGQWIAPTLDPDELQKRIEELRTVQFWLEQNAKLIGTTVQALEVQRMTLSTLRGMNVSFADMGQALKMTVPSVAAASARAPAPPPAPAAAPAAAAASASPRPRARKTEAAAPAGGKPAAPVDPLQWWGALTQQFSEIASKALRDSLKDGGAGAARGLGGDAMAQGVQAAGTAIERAMALSSQASAAAVNAANAIGKAGPAGKPGKTGANGGAGKSASTSGTKRGRA